ncbi:hypothetical protein HYU10_00080 [Candidatus Woesearchaeota archaeon]|nr:hypothetical protein [Candidatus Woesearchaeota archaeon]MBI2130148.1 hypothetical protein [Candidatus Woesearchaeota archaeon]
MVVFLDTYALIEIDKGNISYKEYAIRPDKAMITVFNLIEIHFYYIKNHGEKEAAAIYSAVKPLVVPISDSIIKDANAFKLANLKKRFSFADCIGYAAARKFNARFVTGDYLFKGLEGVEFTQ